jgi:hypothetical protein
LTCPATKSQGWCRQLADDAFQDARARGLDVEEAFELSTTFVQAVLDQAQAQFTDRLLSRTIH